MHYAHSCLVPIDITKIKVLYVFVTINIQEDHIIKTLQKNFPKGSRIATFGTIQFNPAVHSVRDKLLNDEEHMLYIIPPQIKPLSRGEVLGCTSERLDKDQYDAMVFIGDGRFHLESAMIHNRKFLHSSMTHTTESSLEKDTIKSNSWKLEQRPLKSLGRVKFWSDLRCIR